MPLRAILFATLLIIQASLSNLGLAQTTTKALLRNSIQMVIDSSGARVGVGILGLDFNDSLTINGSARFAMQSVYKFPLALFVLSKVDKGTLSLSRIIHIPKGHLDTATWSPLIVDSPNRDINISVANLLIYTVSKSDNNTCDVLFQLVGGTKAVNKYIHSLGVKDIAIAATEAEMKRDWTTLHSWQAQNTNWCEPIAMLQLLQGFYKGRYLSKATNNFLMKIMIESTNSPNRIMGQLPHGTIVAHKTGTSNTNEKGITSVTNDVGIITLPNGKHFAIVIYISNSSASLAGREGVIATIAKLTWDYFTVK